MSIRIARTSDGPALAAIYAPSVEGSAISFEMTPPDGNEMSQRIERLLATHPWLVWDEEGEAIAYAYASPHRSRRAYCWACEVSVYVGPQARRRGIARQLYHALFDILRQQGMMNAYSGITLPNPASVGLHESLGFKLVGIYRDIGFKAGGWHDVGWWGLQLQTPTDNPEEPLPFATLRSGLGMD